MAASTNSWTLRLNEGCRIIRFINLLHYNIQSALFKIKKLDFVDFANIKIAHKITNSAITKQVKIECACQDSLKSMEIFLVKQSYDILQSILSVYIYIHLSDIYIFHMVKLHLMNKSYQNENKYIFTIYNMYNY